MKIPGQGDNPRDTCTWHVHPRWNLLPWKNGRVTKLSRQLTANGWQNYFQNTLLFCVKVGRLHTLSNTSRTFASELPSHMLSNSGPLTDMKLAWHWLATALARRVFPQPGGPKNSTPLDGASPNFSNFSGWRTGSWTSSWSSRLTSSMPPISSQGTFGISVFFSRSVLGLVRESAHWKRRTGNNVIERFSPSDGATVYTEPTRRWK